MIHDDDDDDDDDIERCIIIRVCLYIHKIHSFLNLDLRKHD